MADVVDLEMEGLSRFRVIGTGGFATVYAAWDDTFRRWVAVKVLPKLDDDGRRRFDRERALMGQLDTHPNVVTPYRSGYTAAGDGFLVMEYVDGDSLETVLGRRGSLGLDESIGYLLPIVDAVDAGHRRGILHLDIKPANILLTADGVPKLADFGIGATRDATTTAAAFTLAHAPPESFADGFDRQDERSDLYALASTLYTLVRGRSPFSAAGQDSVRAHLMRILTHAPPPIGRPDLDDFFAIGLAKDPADRHQSAAELRSALDALSSSPPPRSASVATARPVGPAPSFTPPRPADPGAEHGGRHTTTAGHRVDAEDLGDERVDALRSELAPARRPLRPLLPAAALLLFGAASAAVLYSGTFAGDAEPSIVPGEVPVPTFVATQPPTVPALEPFDTTGSTAPGPGSFSIGQLKLGLLLAEDLPTGWVSDGDRTVASSGLRLPCGEAFNWADDASSPHAVGTYRGPDGTSGIEHTVWALDEYVAADLFAVASALATGCTDSWTEPEAANGGGGVELIVASSPLVTSVGTDTVVYTTTTNASGVEAGRAVHVLSRCDGLVSRLVMTETAAEPTLADDVIDRLATHAYDRLVGVAEWENATCPAG